MKETGVLFNTDMVKAEREDRKTMTRRLDGLKKVNENPDKWELIGTGISKDANNFQAVLRNPNMSQRLFVVKCPFGVVGDRLWVRETFAYVGRSDPGYLVYRATYPVGLPPGTENIPKDIKDAGYKWAPSIHMPRRLCRTVLEITDIRVERVRDISNEDALAEGIIKEDLPPDSDNFHPPGSYGYVSGLYPFPKGSIHVHPHEAFRELWNSVYEKRGQGWNKNPWVWVITFKRI
ncbi:MAG: hypothetical protein KAR06_04200 [Deltaproteobacteria bacterium]|nr:hypothetical protein [Deltaproteobacteria bacterium]